MGHKKYDIEEHLRLKQSVFSAWKDRVYRYQWDAELLVTELRGGVPSDPKTIAGWIKSMFTGNPQLVAEMIAETMAERGIDYEKAMESVAETKNLNGFKRMPDTGELYVEGRQIKAALKEAINIAKGAGTLRSGGYGHVSRKGVSNYAPEHLFVREDIIGLGVTEPSRIDTRFVHAKVGGKDIHSIKAEEVIEEARLRFTVISDSVWPKDFWPIVWVTGEENGIGASRSQGSGRYAVVRWEPVKLDVAPLPKVEEDVVEEAEQVLRESM